MNIAEHQVNLTPTASNSDNKKRSLIISKEILLF